jgi:hypothetical protein
MPALSCLLAHLCRLLNSSRNLPIAAEQRLERLPPLLDRSTLRLTHLLNLPLDDLKRRLQSLKTTSGSSGELFLHSSEDRFFFAS